MVKLAFARAEAEGFQLCSLGGIKFGSLAHFISNWGDSLIRVERALPALF